MLEGSDFVAIAKPPTIYTKWLSSASSTQHLEFAPSSVTSCKSPMAANRKENSMPTPSFIGAVPLPLLKWWIFFLQAQTYLE